MVQKSHGTRHKTRNKLRQKAGERPAITKFLQKFKMGQKVVIVLEASSQKGMPHSRFKGTTGIVVGARGKSFVVEIRDGGKKKTVISRPEHLARA